MTIQKRGTNQTGEQLKMFMTPREIHAQYQPLDADRMESPGSTYVPRGSERSTFQGRSGYRRTTGGSYGEYTHYGSKYKEVMEPESSEELWERKHEESYYGSDYDPHQVPRATKPGTNTYREWMGSGSTSTVPPTHQRESLGQFGETESLGESIEKHGVKSPVRLGQTIGSEGKREIVGGHHRLAVQTRLNPDQPVPVLHHADIFEAKSHPSYKYT
jgi:hypothetical protein